MVLVDTHSHVYLPEFDGDRADVIGRALHTGVGQMLLPNIDETTLAQVAETCRQWPSVCLPMIGLHPTSVGFDTPGQPKWIEEQLLRGGYIAIGEVGIDLYRDQSNKERQIEVFDYQVGLAVRHQLPLVIHSREATSLLLEVLRPYKGKVSGVFHCFSGSEEEALGALDLGFYLGIGGVFTYKKSNLPVIVSHTGLEQILLETDAPYLSPVPFRGKRNEPAHVLIVAQAIASHLGISVEEVASITTRNAKKLFSI